MVMAVQVAHRGREMLRSESELAAPVLGCRPCLRRPNASGIDLKRRITVSAANNNNANGACISF